MDTDQRDTWTIIPIRKNTVEVISPTARYTITANKTSFTVSAFEGEEVVEKSYLRHVGHNYLLQQTDRNGVTEQLELRLTPKRVTAHGVIDGAPFTLESKPYKNIPELVDVLRGRNRISLPLINALTAEMDQNARLRKQIFRQVPLRQVLQQPDWVDLGCAIACTICHYLGDPISCLVCQACVEEPPILTARQI